MNLRAAAKRIRERMPLLNASSLYETAPVGFQNQPTFLNAVLEVDAPEDPQELYRIIREVEADLGRERTFANAPRTIDLDILLHGDTVLEAEHLTIPHPRMHERAFVMVPLAEIAGDVRDPRSGITMRDLAGKLGDTSAQVWVIAGGDWIDEGTPGEGGP